MIEIGDYESNNNLCLIEEDYLTKKIYVTLIYSPKMVRKWNMEHVSSKLLQYQQEYYEEYFVPMQLERHLYNDFLETSEKKYREFNKFSKKEFMNIYNKLTFEINLEHGMLGTFVSDDIYEETSFKKFDYFQVAKRNEKINKKEYTILKNEKILYTDTDSLYRSLFSIKNQKIKSRIPNVTKEIFRMYFEELVDYIMMWLNDTNKEKKLKKEIIKEYIKDVKKELVNVENDIIYRIKNHQMALKNEYKYINEKNKNEKKLSSIYKLVVENDVIKFLKDN